MIDDTPITSNESVCGNHVPQIAFHPDGVCLLGQRSALLTPHPLVRYGGVRLAECFFDLSPRGGTHSKRFGVHRLIACRVGEVIWGSDGLIQPTPDRPIRVFDTCLFPSSEFCATRCRVRCPMSALELASCKLRLKSVFCYVKSSNEWGNGRAARHVKLSRTYLDRKRQKNRINFSGHFPKDIKDGPPSSPFPSDLFPLPPHRLPT